jgi:hypothetical protein
VPLAERAERVACPVGVRKPQVGPVEATSSWSRVASGAGTARQGLGGGIAWKVPIALARREDSWMRTGRSPEPPR